MNLKWLSSLWPFSNASQSTASFDAMNHDMVSRVFGGVNSAGMMVNETSSQRLATAWACRRILSESIGMLPRGMFRREANGNASPATDHWLHELLVKMPNRDQTGAEFMETLTLNLTGDGNAYCLIDRVGTRIASLYPFVSACVTPMRKKGTNTRLNIRDGEVFFRVSDGGVPEDYPREKIWHSKIYGPDALKGLSPLRAASEAMGGALAQQDFANKFFSQGAMPSAVVSVPQWLNPDQKKQAEEAVQKMAGLGKMHSVALFQGGMKPEPWDTMNLEEMQLVMARRFSTLEICRYYLVPPHRVYELEKGASYASVELMSQDFVTNSLMPYFKRYEESIERWLLSPADRAKYFFKFNFEGMLRAASKERAELESLWVQNGIMTRNEVRGKENLNRVEAKGMDDLTVQLNLTPIDKLGQEKKEEPVVKPEPEAKAPVVVMPQNDTGSLQLVLSESATERVKVDHPALQEVVSLTKAAESRMEKRMLALEQSTRKAVSSLELSTRESVDALERSASESIRAMAESVAGSIASVERVARMPRKAVIKNPDTPEEAIYAVVVDEVVH